MISVDTSVVVRYLVGTPTGQAARAARLIENEAAVGISLVALAETAHVLRSFYRMARPDVVEVLIDLMTRANIASLEIPTSETIDALVRARAFASSPITDALIAAVARSKAGTPVFTFDRRFGRLGVEAAAP